MNPGLQHPWDVSTQEAMAIQERLAPQVIRDDLLGPPPGTASGDGPVRHVAGVDIGFEAAEGVATSGWGPFKARYAITRAAVVVLSFPELEVVDQVLIRRPTDFPYIPGLLSFREIPAALEAFGELSVQPDLVLCDGQGLAHPRRLGLACHIGLLLDLPTIGVAKSRLIGTHDEPGREKGSWTPLRHARKGEDEEIVGAVLRSRDGVKPLFVSPGHRVGLESAVEWVLACTPKYRLPETTRRAHHLASHWASVVETP